MENLKIPVDFIEKSEFERELESRIEDNDAVIQIVFKHAKGWEKKFNIGSDIIFNDLNHLGNSIRKMIRNRLNNGTKSATCIINPWNIILEVDEVDYRIRNET